MAFFTKRTDAESIKEGGNGSKYITTSGLYDMTILATFVSGTDKSPAINLFVDYNGQQQALYSDIRLTNNDGSENFGAKIFNKLLVVADVDSVADPVEATLPIGKGGADKDVPILEEISDVDVKVHIQLEYSIYSGSIREKTLVKNFYRADGASAEEIVNGTEIGVNLEKSRKYFENVSYKDGLTEEAVKEWIAANRPKGTAGSSSAASAPKRPSFAKKTA